MSTTKTFQAVLLITQGLELPSAISAFQKPMEHNQKAKLALGLAYTQLINAVDRLTVILELDDTNFLETSPDEMIEFIKNRGIEAKNYLATVEKTVGEVVKIADSKPVKFHGKKP